MLFIAATINHEGKVAMDFATSFVESDLLNNDVTFAGMAEERGSR